MSVLGHELYSWQEDGDWRYALTQGTKHAKTRDQITNPQLTLRNLDALRAKLRDLPSGEQLAWSDGWVPGTALPPNHIVQEVTAFCQRQGVLLVIPERAVQVSWDADPEALIIRYYSPYTTAGLSGAYDRRYYIPEAQVWGNGRIIWVHYQHPKRRVLEGYLTIDEMRALLQRVVDAGYFSWREEYYTLGGNSHPHMVLAVNLADHSKEVREHGGAPAAFYELRDFLSGGAGAAGHDYLPEGGYLTATVWPEDVDVQVWPYDASGISLDQAEEGCTIEGEVLAFSWSALNQNPTAPIYVRSKGRVYTIMLQIAGISYFEPRPQGTVDRRCVLTPERSTEHIPGAFLDSWTRPAATPTGTPRPVRVPTDTTVPTPVSPRRPSSGPGVPPQVVSFTANPSPADPAGMIALTWRVQGASGVEISWSDIENDNVVRSDLPLAGNLDLAVSGVRFTGGDAVRFLLSATDADGALILDDDGRAVAELLTVPLRTDMTIASFAVSPNPVERGGIVTLTWNVLNASSVGITRLSSEGGIFLAPEALDLPSSGSTTLAVPGDYVRSITYYLGARDAHGVLEGAYATVGITCAYDDTIAPECPLTHDYVHAAHEPFEHGVMVWRGDIREIYVLYDDGSLETYEDTWTEGEPIYLEDTPPQGLLQPIRGFGDLWANHPAVRDKLGWATGEESGYSMLVETVRRHFGRYPRSVIYLRLPDNRVVHLDESLAQWDIVPPIEGHVQVESDARGAESVPGWRTYTSEDYGFVFEHPPDAVLELPSKGDTPVIIHTSDTEGMHIAARRDYLPGDVAYLLDTAPSGTLALGDNVWQVYDLPQGYADGPAVSPPLLALQLVVDDVLYTVSFPGVTSMSPVQEQVLATFQVPG